MRCCLACCNAGRLREQNEYSPGHGRYALGTASAAAPARGLMPSFENFLPALPSLAHCCAALCHCRMIGFAANGGGRRSLHARCLPVCCLHTSRHVPACIPAGRRRHRLFSSKGHSGGLSACSWHLWCCAVKFIMFFVTMLITLIYWTFLGKRAGWLGVEWEWEGQSARTGLGASAASKAAAACTTAQLQHMHHANSTRRPCPRSVNTAEPRSSRWGAMHHSCM